MAFQVRIPGPQRFNQGKDLSALPVDTCKAEEGQKNSATQERNLLGNSYGSLYPKKAVTPVTPVTDSTSPPPKGFQSAGRSAATEGIPAGAILMAPRFDSSPLERIPKCWCCRAEYRLDRIQEWEGKKYAWLDPECRCLDTAQAIRCCGLCTEHCACRTRKKANNCLPDGG